MGHVPSPSHAVPAENATMQTSSLPCYGERRGGVCVQCVQMRDRLRGGKCGGVGKGKRSCLPQAGGKGIWQAAIPGILFPHGGTTGTERAGRPTTVLPLSCHAFCFYTIPYLQASIKVKKEEENKNACMLNVEKIEMSPNVSKYVYVKNYRKERAFCSSYVSPPKSSRDKCVCAVGRILLPHGVEGMEEEGSRHVKLGVKQVLKLLQEESQQSHGAPPPPNIF